MLNRFLVFLSVPILLYCDGFPASVNETDSPTSQEMDLYNNNSTDEDNYELNPFITPLRHIYDEIELGRKAFMPFFTFLYDALGQDEEEMGESLDDYENDNTEHQIPDEPSDPNFSKGHCAPTETTEPSGKPIPFFKNPPYIYRDIKD